MTLTQIRYFLEAAKTRNYTKAAANLFVSQQVVSKHVHLLEANIGFPLFEKNQKALALTPAGQLMYDTWSRQLEETTTALAEALLMTRQQTIITLGIVDLRHVMDLVMPQIAFLTERFPNITFKYFLGDFAAIEQAMSLGDIDMAITLSTEIPMSIPPEQILKIQNLELGIFMNRNHPLAARENVTIKDLSHETFYLLDEHLSRDSGNKVLIDCHLHGFEPIRTETFNNIHTLEFALASNYGVHVGFDIFFQDPANRIKMYPITGVVDMEKADLVLAWKNPYLSSMAQALAEQLIKEQI